MLPPLSEAPWQYVLLQTRAPVARSRVAVGERPPVLARVPKVISVTPLRWVAPMAGVVGTLWHSLQATLAENGMVWLAASRCLVCAPAMALVAAVEPAMDLNGLVVAVL